MCRTGHLPPQYTLTDQSSDYYYYATAGGAKIWVRGFMCASLFANLVKVEKIFDHHANRPVCDRYLCRLLWKCAAASRLRCMTLTTSNSIPAFCARKTAVAPSFRQLRRLRTCCSFWLHSPHKLPRPVHQFLHADVQEVGRGSQDWKRTC